MSFIDGFRLLDQATTIIVIVTSSALLAVLISQNVRQRPGVSAAVTGVLVAVLFFFGVEALARLLAVFAAAIALRAAMLQRQTNIRLSQELDDIKRRINSTDSDQAGA